MCNFLVSLIYFLDNTDFFRVERTKSKIKRRKRKIFKYISLDVLKEIYIAWAL